MSGGSYDYLCFNSDSLSGHRGDLERMAVRLEGLPWAAQAADATRRCLTMVNEAQTLAETLSDAWHAIEWWDSCDWDESRARAIVEAFAAPDGQRAEDMLYRLVDVGGGRYELRPVSADA